MTATTRTEFTAKLRKLADLLDEHPAIPIDPYLMEISAHLELDDYEGIEQLVAYLEVRSVEHTVHRGSDRRKVILLGGSTRSCA